MQFDLNEVQTLLVEASRRLLEEESGVEYWRRQRGDPHGFEAARWAQFADLGWLSLLLPEAAGGFGGGAEDSLLLNIELGRALAPEPYVSHAVEAAPLLAAIGGGAAALVEGAADGSVQVALAGRAPTASDNPAVRLRPDGDGWILSGVRTLVLDAASAAYFIVPVHLDDEAAFGLVLVPKETQGLSLTDYPLIDGARAADLTFEGVRLPSDALLAQGGQAEGLYAEATDRGRLARLAQAVGSMEACLKLCGDYARERHQFGVPIGSFQAIQHLLADMFVAADQARSILYHAASHQADAPEKRRRALDAASLITAASARTVGKNGVQIHGGYGVTDEYAISHHYRRLLALTTLTADSATDTNAF
nr:acyl-CoA dehydrogenase family protein [uncultured Brevundimonas sp.]